MPAAKRGKKRSATGVSASTRPSSSKKNKIKKLKRSTSKKRGGKNEAKTSKKKGKKSVNKRRKMGVSEPKEMKEVRWTKAQLKRNKQIKAEYEL